MRKSNSAIGAAGYKPVLTFDTSSVGPSDRLDYWEEQCADHVVGLKCSCLGEEGLQARLRHADFGSIGVSEIVGKEHLIERSSAMVRRVEKDAVFATLVLRGSAFFNQAGRCILLNAGDSFLYDTNHPYLHGVPAAMHHIIFEVPGEDFRRRFPGWKLNEVQRYEGSEGVGGNISRAFRELLTRRWPADGSAAEGEAFEDELYDVLWMAHRTATGGRLSTYHLLMMDRIREFIRANLRDPELSPSTIAQHTGISVRQLNRLFEMESRSVGQTVLSMRLEKCRTDLLDKEILNPSIYEIAYHWGFRSAANFSRCFRDHFGCSPSEARSRL